MRDRAAKRHRKGAQRPQALRQQRPTKLLAPLIERVYTHVHTPSSLPEKAWPSATLPPRLPACGQTTKTTTQWTMATRRSTVASCAQLMCIPRPMHFMRLDNQSQTWHPGLHEHSMLDYQHRALHRHTVDRLPLRSPSHINLDVLPQRGAPHAPPQPMDCPWMDYTTGLLPVHRQLVRQAQR